MYYHGSELLIFGRGKFYVRGWGGNQPLNPPLGRTCALIQYILLHNDLLPLVYLQYEYFLLVY